MKKDEKFESLLKEYRMALEKVSEFQLKKQSLFDEYLDSAEAVCSYIDNEISKKDRRSAETEMKRIDNEIYKKFLSKLPQEEL
jgi:hypothetical protein